MASNTLQLLEDSCYVFAIKPSDHFFPGEVREEGGTMGL